MKFSQIVHNINKVIRNEKNIFQLFFNVGAL